MIRTYGQSILNLVRSGETDEANICAKIGKCFSGEKSSLAFAKVSGKCAKSIEIENVHFYNNFYIKFSSSLKTDFTGVLK